LVGGEREVCGKLGGRIPHITSTHCGSMVKAKQVRCNIFQTRRKYYISENKTLESGEKEGEATWRRFLNEKKGIWQGDGLEKR